MEGGKRRAPADRLAENRGSLSFLLLSLRLAGCRASSTSSGLLAFSCRLVRGVGAWTWADASWRVDAHWGVIVSCSEWWLSFLFLEVMVSDMFIQHRSFPLVASKLFSEHYLLFLRHTLQERKARLQAAATSVTVCLYSTFFPLWMLPCTEHASTLPLTKPPCALSSPLLHCLL